MYIKATERTGYIISFLLSLILLAPSVTEHSGPDPSDPYYYLVYLGWHVVFYSTESPSHDTTATVRILHKDRSRDPDDPLSDKPARLLVCSSARLLVTSHSTAFTHRPFFLPYHYILYSQTEKATGTPSSSTTLYLLKAHQCEWDCAPLFASASYASYASDHLYLTSALVRWRSSFTRPDIRP
jgi:hypothetical protein